MKIKIRVKPNSSKQKIEKNGEGYIVFLKSPPKDNKANLELIKLLNKFFKKKNIKIKSGLNSRNKILEIKN
ncbi:MAG TPA: DUF167 family protein [Candidatus Paceibacterota bacterium]|nr:DUF167 family protein [Candidatus Paceibacterota bacterium]